MCRRIVILGAALALAACVRTPAPLTPATTPGFSPEITAADFAAHLKTLASDAFEGREPGSAVERQTTAYIRGQFARIGLAPGNGGAWFQAVPTITTTLTNTDLTLDIAGANGTEKLIYRVDVLVNNLSARPEVKLTGSAIVFVGYGVDAPDQHWNDYAGLDVRGKTVVVLVNDPGWSSHDDTLFKGRAMTYYGRWTYKFEEAARHGAAAALIVHDTDAAGYGWGVVQSSWSGPQFDLPTEEDPAPRLDVAGWISGEAARRLFAASGADFDAMRRDADRRGFRPVALAAKASVTLRSAITRGSSDNVIGVLRGTTRPDEAIVYSAHWDHLGRDDSLDGDRIYNGAIDNGTGIAGLLEIAEAFAHQRPPPERTIVFAAVTLEESGLLGSKYYAAHPPFPLADTVADITMDAMPLIGRARDMSVIGHGQYELDDYLAQALEQQDRHIAPDDAPEKGRYFRSDHFSFARRGVPALYVKGGVDLREGGIAAGKAAVDDYTRNRYHKPSDEFRDDFRFDGVIEDLQTLHAVGRRLGGETTWPQWSTDSEFRATRDAMRPY